jgi:hypothetical protein
MENSSGSILGGIGIALSVISMVYAAVNHKKIKAKCCGRTYEIELDVTSTEQGQRETETKRWSWKDFMNGRKNSKFIPYAQSSTASVAPISTEKDEHIPYIRPPIPKLIIHKVPQYNNEMTKNSSSEINIINNTIKNIYYTPPHTPPRISPPHTPPPSTPPHIPYIVNNQNKKENYDEVC